MLANFDLIALGFGTLCLILAIVFLSSVPNISDSATKTNTQNAAWTLFSFSATFLLYVLYRNKSQLMSLIGMRSSAYYF